MMNCQRCGSSYSPSTTDGVCGACKMRSTTGDAFVSCSLCGAIFTGEVLPQHVCLHTGIYPTPDIFPTPMYIPPTLTLRDYFAGQALAGLTARGGWTDEDRAKVAYAFADAMIKEREKA